MEFKKECTEIYERYGYWYVCMNDTHEQGGVHLAGPFKTQVQAQQVVQMQDLAARVFH